MTTQYDTIKTPPCSDAEYERRVNMVYEMMLSGLSNYEISKGLEKAGVKVGKRQIERYRHEANKLINETYGDEREKMKNIFLSKYNMLYKRTVASKDFKTAVSILEKQSKMLGISENAVSTDNNINFTHTIINA